MLKISAPDSEDCSVKYVSEITEGEKRTESNCAISVYIPKSGDDLWSTAKNLRQSPDEIKSTNPDLAFPLTGSERIVVFRAKTE